jgi:hypothetical protein
MMQRFIIRHDAKLGKRQKGGKEERLKGGKADGKQKSIVGDPSASPPSASPPHSCLLCFITDIFRGKAERLMGN